MICRPTRRLVFLGMVGASHLAAPLTAQEQVVVTAVPAEAIIEVGGTVQLTAQVQGAGDDVDVDGEARWFVENPELATVSEDGVVTGLRPGVARVAAIFRGRAGWSTVRVLPLPAARLEVRALGPVMAGTTTPFVVQAWNRLDQPLEEVPFTTTVEDPAIASITGDRILGSTPGTTTVTFQDGDAETTLDIQVGDNPASEYELLASSDTDGLRTGDVVAFRFAGRGPGGEDIPLNPMWSASPSGASVEPVDGRGLFVAENPGRYHITAVAGPSIARTVIVDVAERTHSERLELVGAGIMSSHRAGDTWVFEGTDGRDYAYIGTFYHDWMKVWDVTDPTAPVLTDSVQLDARRINDVKIHPNNRLGIVTREGASTRRNGIVLLDLADPAHPTVVSEYTDTVTGGVHNVWILGEEELVYACHNGTSEIVIIDIADPANPVEIGRWGHDEPVRSLHDVIVQDGYAYASFWNEGVYILDAGAGTHGGTAREPTFVSRWVSEQGNTHVAWRHGKYLFAGAEIFPSDWDPDALGPIEARGYIEVLDMSDIESPVHVANYAVPEAGAHNLWSDDRDRLYIGYYQAGLRVLDISGELRGDLYRQGREIGHVKTASTDGAVPNWSMTWGAQLHKGRIYTSDLHSGLWIARLVERELVP